MPDTATATPATTTAATESTTRTSRARAGAAGRRVRLANRLGALVILAAGLGLTALAVPQMLGAFAALPAERALHELEAGEARDATHQRALLETVVRSSLASADWFATPARYNDAGYALMTLATLAPDAAARRRLFEEARQALRQSVALGPVNPFGWARLAFIEFSLGGPSPVVAESLHNSFLTGRYVPPLVGWRLQTALLAWDALDPATRDMAADQVAILWRLDPEQLVRLSQVPRFEGPILEAMKASAPGEINVPLTRPE